MAAVASYTHLAEDILPVSVAPYAYSPPSTTTGTQMDLE